MKFRRKPNQKINSLIFYLAQCTTRLFNFEFPRQLVFCLHGTEILAKPDQKRAISGLRKVATFALLMSASSVATAYGISIPNDPINDSVIVRLQTTSIIPVNLAFPGDTEITNWWVEAGSTGFGAGQSDHFSSGQLEAPLMTPLNGNPNPDGSVVQGGTGNALVTDLPTMGEQVFISIWLKRQDQPWELALVSVITASSSMTPTAIVERNRYSYDQYYFGQYVWGSTSMASWYQIWVNDYTGTNVHNKWYSHKEVCMNTQAYIATDCATDIPSSPGFGTYWVRAWSADGGYGPWSQPAVVNFEI